VNDRERFLQTMLFGKPDRVTYWPFGLREIVLRRWRTEGLPGDVYPASHLGLDHVEPLLIDGSPIPRFEEVLIEEGDGYRVWIDELGVTRRDFRQPREPTPSAPGTPLARGSPEFGMSQWLEFPVKDRQSFLRMRDRYNPTNATRYPEWWGTRVRYYRDRDFVLGLSIRSLFWQIREWMGFEATCMAFLDQPSLVQEMMEFVADFLIELLRPAVRDVEIDYVMFNEDMAYKTGPMISPKMAREFMLPQYRKIVGFLRSSGVPVIVLDSDGLIEDLIPLWIEAGFNATYPIEVAAGNDLIAYRKRFGRDFAYIGGLDKRELAKGKAEVEAEVMGKLPWMLEHGGGYIPTCDHGIPPDVSYANYLEMLRCIRQAAES
jgi:hypothetical protein